MGKHGGYRGDIKLMKLRGSESDPISKVLILGFNFQGRLFPDVRNTKGD